MVIAAVLASPVTATGVVVLVVVPLPNWPEMLLPQHLAVPFANVAHECGATGADGHDIGEAADEHRRRRAGRGAVPTGPCAL